MTKDTISPQYQLLIHFLKQSRLCILPSWTTVATVYDQLENHAATFADHMTIDKHIYITNVS